MKISNKTIIVITLIFIVGAMSVIYAALSSNLNITSTANVGSNMEFDIKLQGLKCEVVKGTGANTIAGSITTTAATSVTTSGTVLYAPGDEVKCTFKAVNNGNIDVILDSVDVDGITNGTITYTDGSTLSTADQELIEDYVTYTFDDNDSKDIIENNDIKSSSTEADRVLKGDGGVKQYKIIIKFSDDATNLPSKSILMEDITSNLLYIQTGKVGSDPKATKPEGEFEVADSVYFNPVTGQKCSDYTASQSKGNSNTGCLKWYVIGTNGNNVDLFLDHNTTYKVKWNLSGSNASGPNELLTSLQNDTSGWTGVPTRSDSYVDGAHSYTINYTGYKARLITADEVWNITKDTNGKSNWSSATNDKGFYFEGSQKSGQGTSAYPWLFDYTSSCTTYGCNTTSRTSGYWTASSVASGTDNAWGGYYLGNLGMGSVGVGTLFGVRPVITISSSNL